MLSLSKKQNEYINNAGARWNLKIGAVRSGKSFVDIAYVILSRLRAVKDEAGLNVILGVSRETIERNVLEPMREIYTDAIVGNINARNVAYIAGVPVYCLGAEKVSQVAKIQGSSIKYCYGDEIAKWNKEVFAMLQSRLDKPYSRFDGACNPEYPSHWLKEFIDKPDIDAYIQSYTIFDNPYLPQGYVENLCKEYEGTVYYGRYIKGEWTLAEGLIYPMYKDAIEEPPEEKPEAYVLSIDYGTQNAFSCGLWGKYRDKWYRLKEYYYSGRNTGIQKTDEEYATDLDNFIKDVPFTERIRTIIDPSAASFIALLKKRGKYHVVPAKNDVADGIRETATAMKQGYIKVSPECKSWIKEVQGYVWDDTAADDRPVKVDDHAMDDSRYFVKTMKIARPKTPYTPLYM
jgi:PBSX family phage terminase large subunit